MGICSSQSQGPETINVWLYRITDFLIIIHSKINITEASLSVARNSYLSSRDRSDDRQVSNCKIISCYKILVFQELIQEFIRLLYFLILLWVSRSFSKHDWVLQNKDWYSNSVKHINRDSGLNQLQLPHYHFWQS